MLNGYSKIRSRVVIICLTMATVLPIDALATGGGHKGGWGVWMWIRELFGFGAEAEATGSTAAVPEFSVGVAVAALLLLVGGTLILLSQRRKKQLSK